MVQRFTSDLSYWHIRDNSGRVVQLARSNVQGGSDVSLSAYSNGSAMGGPGGMGPGGPGGRW